jgi:lipid-A-disaccharide synthase
MRPQRAAADVALRGGRIGAIARSVDHVLTLFPFEEGIYRMAGVPATYVGHPLADLIPEQDQTASTRNQLKIAPERKVKALSRNQAVISRSG